ncbi:hypothetical protein D3C74_392020 [compost metagenome]
MRRKLKCLNRENVESFAVRNASTNTTLEKIVRNGKEEQPLSDSHFTLQKSGKMQLKLYGREMMQLVEDVEKGFLAKKDSNFIYITLSRLDIRNIEQMLTICYWYAKGVIDGYIVDKTQTKSLLLEYIVPYSEGISDTQRFRSIGNGWTVDVIAHILKELKNT